MILKKNLFIFFFNVYTLYFLTFQRLYVSTSPVLFAQAAAVFINQQNGKYLNLVKANRDFISVEFKLFNRCFFPYKKKVFED